MVRLEKITLEDKRYPQQLRSIKRPPKQLYVEGNIELLYTPIISIIGSRACSRNGVKLTRQFSRELVYQNLTIASGMALGIDSIAHQTAIEEKGNTIAVLGSGLRCIFPSENEPLYQQILENNGLVISEYGPKEKAKSKNFLERNRIVSGLALGILVIEAAYRSGTSVTAKLAKQQGRKIFTIPHEIGDKHGIGTNRLIQEGAKMITSTKELIQELPGIVYKQPPKEKKEEQETRQRKICKNKAYAEIYQWITDKPITVNEICQRSNKEITEINHVLFMLEVEEYIKKVAGGYICILDKK